MPAFNYQAIDKSNKSITGSVQADSQKQARAALRQQGLMISSLTVQKASTSLIKPISTLELSLITRQFAILLSSDLSIEQALFTLAAQLDNEQQKAVLNGVRQEIIAGKPLATALKMYPKVFPAVYCSLVHAGEQSGALANVMTKLADYSDKTRALTSKIMMALLYPLIVSIVAVLVIAALLVFVVPQVIKVFEASKQTLPLITRIMIGASDGLRNYGIYGVIILVIWVVLFMQSLKNQQTKIKFHKQLLRLPIAGKLLMNIDLARFTNTLSLLLSSGVSMLQALTASRDTVNNFMLKMAIDRAIALVREGVSVAAALNAQQAFPPVVIHLIGSGEKSGTLDRLLLQAGSHQELELTHRSQLLTGILEPALIVFMGFVVMFIVIGIMLPILDMNKIVM